MYRRYKMSKMRLALILVVAIMMLITTTGCNKKPTEPAITPGEMIFIPGGTFTMGDTRQVVDEDYNENELPTHRVTLNPFYIGKYEVTQAEFSKYMQPINPWISKFGLGKNYPAYNVSWYEALKYCNLRSSAEGLTPCYTIRGFTNPNNWGEVPNDYEHPARPIWDAAICNFSANGYRLPTEAEWEYAARGATNDPDYLYSGSEDISAVAWYHVEGDPIVGSSHPVGKKAPNGIGTHDMSGNVNEWCWDAYGRNYYEDSPQNNPTGPEFINSRVSRGGNWLSEAVVCRVANRSFDNPNSGYFNHGFRLCRSYVD